MARRREEEADEGVAEWMATYADLVTLLLCFFVLMFSMSSVDASKFKAVVNSFQSDISLFYGGETIGNGSLIGAGINQLPEYANIVSKELTTSKAKLLEDMNRKTAKNISKFIADKKLSDNVKVEFTDSYIKLLFVNDTVFFDNGQAILKKGAIEVLDVLCEQLYKFKDNDIKIEGHTDNVPIRTKQFPSNMYLSSARAISVYEYLVNNKGFDKDKLSAVGYGENHPYDTNDTVEGRSKNRRVEFKILTSGQ